MSLGIIVMTVVRAHEKSLFSFFTFFTFLNLGPGVAGQHIPRVSHMSLGIMLMTVVRAHER